MEAIAPQAAGPLHSGFYYGEPVPGIVEVEPETLSYSLKGSASACDAI
ncbi:MAG: hypothetical protein ACM37W_12205 [Actinomycetota bacterium]